MLVSVGSASDLVVPEFLLRMSANFLEFGNAIDGVNGEAESIGLVVDRQLHRSVDIAFLLVPSHVQSLVPPTVGQAVNQPRITMEVENDGLVKCKQRIEIAVG